MTTSAKTRKVVEGVIEVCCHQVSWWFDLDGLTETPEMRERLEEEAEERAKACIIDGCVTGDLCALWVDDEDKTHELWGWFQIVRE